ncbi:hypothetical protein IPJ91_00065 [bacterium]|nr:MAG: hypothetical protein IPJ91_00065 [bacterium]
MFVLSKGETFSDTEGKVCVDYLNTFLRIEFIEEKAEISCQIGDFFPTFLSTESFEYKLDKDHLDLLIDLGLTNKSCNDLENHSYGNLCYEIFQDKLKHKLVYNQLTYFVQHEIMPR